MKIIIRINKSENENFELLFEKKSQEVVDKIKKSHIIYLNWRGMLCYVNLL